ncbi:MAG TPA: glycosyltransferase family 4 protein [bacterium]|nr:glycosyltransferase family 4 protein [bacterium]
MKIGIVTEYYYPLLGGISEHVHNTKEKLQEMGHDVKIITSNCSAFGNSKHQFYNPSEPGVLRMGRGVPVYSNGSFAHMTIGTNLAARMRSILDSEKFDLLHLHSPIVVTLPPLAAREAKCALVGTFHTYFEGSLVYSALKHYIQRSIVDRLDGQIAVSKVCTDALGRYFKLRARVIPNGVDTDQFRPDVAPLEEFDGGKLNLLFLSRFDPRNGLALMIKAFELIKADFADVRLIVIGNGPLNFYYRRLVPRELREDVRFEGLSKDKRPAYYASCDVFCSPVMKASFGVTLLEAMASGKPIVATENSGYRELLGPEESILVPPKNPAAFAGAVVSLLKDVKLRREMGQNGRRKAMRYSWDKVTREIATYYDEILGA